MSKHQYAIRYEYPNGAWIKKNQLLYKDIPAGEFNHITAVKNHMLRKGVHPSKFKINLRGMRARVLLVGLNEKSY